MAFGRLSHLSPRDYERLFHPISRDSRGMGWNNNILLKQGFLRAVDIIVILASSKSDLIVIRRQ